MHPRLYLWYARSQGLWLVAAWLLLFLCFEALNVYANFWLSFWTDDPRLRNSSANASSFAPASTLASYSNSSVPSAATSDGPLSSSTLAATSTSRTPATPAVDWNWTTATATATASGSLVSSDATSAARSLRAIQFYYLRAICWIVLARFVLFAFHSVLYVVGSCLSSRSIHAKVMGNGLIVRIYFLFVDYYKFRAAC